MTDGRRRLHHRRTVLHHGRKYASGRKRDAGTCQQPPQCAAASIDHGPDGNATRRQQQTWHDEAENIPGERVRCTHGTEFADGLRELAVVSPHGTKGDERYPEDGGRKHAADPRAPLIDHLLCYAHLVSLANVIVSATRKSHQDAASEQLMFVSGYVYRLLRAKARGLGIRWSGLMVLVDLDLLGPTEQRRLVEIEKVRGSTMTVLLQDLERRGWVEREAHEVDARVTRVMITASGRTELRRAGRLLRDHLNAELSGMPERVLRDVAASLKPLSSALMQKTADFG